MAFLKNKWAMLSMLVLLWAMVASLTAGYYWFQYNDTFNRIGGVSISVNVGIDYGNQTRTWNNSTKALTGMTLFKVTKDVANITYGTSVGFGAYVESINGLGSSGAYGWVWWKWDEGLNWTMISISADAYAVADNETFLWYYASGWPPPPPP
ncbi:MAG TPA: hypothetical protein VIH48_00860 [Candidatus Bathyarchaeia archaeon]